MIVKRKQLKASVSLTTVLVTSAILLLSGTTLLFGTIDSGRVSKDSLNYQLAVIQTFSCLEEALNMIKRSQAYEGLLTIDFENGQCQATVSTDPMDSNMKLVDIESQYESYEAQAEKIVDLTTSPYTISNQ